MKKIVLVLALFAWVAFSVNAQAVKTPIEVSKLPKEITDYVTSQYQKCKIIYAESVTENNVFTYIVNIACNDKKTNLSFNKDKKFIKEEPAKADVVKPVKPGESQPPVTTQPVKPVPAKVNTTTPTDPKK